jgi:diguanylate cyclase (GGDEF)-like protein
MEIKNWTSLGSRTGPAAVGMNWSAVEKSMDSEKSLSGMQSIALAAIQHVLLTGSLPDDLPQSMVENPQFLQIVAQLEQLQEYLHALANGSLEPEIKLKGRMAGALKTLQSRLRQTQETLEQHTSEFTEERRVALEMMQEAQQVRAQVEAANASLQNRLEEVQALQMQLNEQIMRDPITGCFNRRYLEETLRREFSRAKREDYPLSLVMVDIDHFKQINDTYGHPAGDAVLQALGILLRGQTRAGDIVCRYGGDEFLLVLPNMKPDDVTRRAEAWRVAFHDMEIYYGELQLQSTISIGVAFTPEHGTDGDEVIRAVDKALYRAKNAGRNCVMSPA